MKQLGILLNNRAMIQFKITKLISYAQRILIIQIKDSLEYNQWFKKSRRHSACCGSYQPVLHFPPWLYDQLFQMPPQCIPAQCQISFFLYYSSILVKGGTNSRYYPGYRPHFPMKYPHRLPGFLCILQKIQVARLDYWNGSLPRLQHCW